MIPTVRYLRVSTTAQADDARFGLSVQQHLAEANERRHGLQVLKTYTDTISGAVASRTGLDALKAEARGLGATGVSISSIDRLSRDIAGGYIILAEFSQAGLEVYSADLRERIDLTNDHSSIDTNLRLLISQLERNRIRDRTYGGLLAKARSGVPVRGVNGYGYRDGKIDEVQAHWVRWIYEQALTRGTTAIAEALNRQGVPPPGSAKAWSKATVSMIVSKPLYKGEYMYGRTLECSSCGRRLRGNQHDAWRGWRECVCGGRMAANSIAATVPAIVEPELWEAVNARRKARRVRHGRAGSRRDMFGLQGHIRCAVCGGTMSAQVMTKARHLRYYYCRRAIDKPEVNGVRDRCSNGRLYRIEPLHEAVLRELQRIFDSEDALRELMTMPNGEATHDYSRERKAIAQRLERAREAYLAGEFELGEYADVRRRLERELAAVPEPTPVKRLPRDLTTYRAAVLMALDTMPLHEVMHVSAAMIRVAPGMRFFVELA